VPLPEPARAHVAELVEGVRAAADPAVRDVRWVRLDGLHLTLRFIGPVPDSTLPAIVDAMKQAAARIAPFDVAIEDAGAFPSTGRPRALWLDVVDGGDELAASAALLDDELAGAGLERTTRPYRAHLTVARSDGVRSGADVARRLIEAGRGRRTTFRATEVVLFESVSGGGPARYVRLAEANLLEAAPRPEPGRSPADVLIPSEPSVESRASVGPHRKEQGPGT
jgi:2'-5' RNA ligase